MTFLKNDSKEDVVDTLQKINKINEEKSKRIFQNRTNVTEEFKQQMKDDKKNKGWTKNRSMKKVFSIPAEVYFANEEYWKKIIKDKKFNLHPEFKI